MTKLVEGGKMPAFVYRTAFEDNIDIADTVKRVEGNTAIVFLRYIGCTMCQYNLHHYLTHYDAIKDAGGQLLIVFQSDPNLVAAEIKDANLPFDIICDPEQALYKQFELGSVPSKEALFDDEGRRFLEKIKAEGFKHGKYEGNEMQLPGAFVVDKDLNVVLAHYGALANDVPRAEELATYLR